MGLSIAIAGGISILSIFLLFTIFPIISETIFEQGTTTSEMFAVDDSILKTDLEFRTLSTSSGSQFGNFFLKNIGKEKLWDYENFDFIVTYDANIGGIKTRVTEQLTYNATAGPLFQPSSPDFRIQRQVTVFGATSDTTTATISTVDLTYAFVKITNVLFSSGGLDTNSDGNGNLNNDDLGVRAAITADDTITFTRLASGGNSDYRIVWEVWEYVGDPGGANEFIVRDVNEATTTGAAAVDTNVPGVVDRNNLIPFISGVTSTQTGRTWDDASHTAQVIDAGGGNTDIRIQRQGTSGTSIVGYAAVEFTGSNWIIQNNRIHTFSASGVNEVHTLPAAVNDWTEAFIVTSYHQRNGQPGLEEQGHNVWPHPTNDDEIHLRLRSGADSVGSGGYIAILHVAENPNLTVEHIDSITGSGTSHVTTQPADNIVNEAITQVNQLAESAVIATHDTAGPGTAYPRANWNYRLSDDDNVEWYRGRDGQPGDWAMQAIQFPGIPGGNPPLEISEWTITSIQPDSLDPSIINSGETATIWFRLQHSVFTNGFVEVSISNEKGVTAGEDTEWYNQSWLYRKLITINSTEVSSDLTNFPVMINLVDLDLRERAQAGADDILFTSSDGTTKLDHEIEKFDVSTGELVAWVRIPSLSSTIDTEIFMYYGNPSTSNQENVVGVWETNYLGIWHFPSEDFLGVATQSAMDGADGGYAVYYGTTPIVGNIMNLAIDEDQIANAERAHTTEQVAYWVFNIENEFDILDTNNNIIGEVGIKRNVDDNWNLVNLRNYYLDPVVVTTYNLDSSADPPAVVRVRNADKYSFEVKLQNPGDLTTPTAADVYYIVMETGSYTLPGSVSVEAGIVSVTGTNENSDWSNTEMIQLNPINSYTNPVVLGQVVTENDPDWSVFWSSNGAQTSPPDSSNIYVGKHVGEDSDTSRNAEDVGYIIIEQSQGTTNGVDWDAALGTDTVDGVESSPPNPYTLPFTVESFLDSTQNNNDGTNFGSTNSGGPIGNAKEFDGTSDYVALNMFFASDTALPQMTASAWVWVNSGEGDWSILDFDRSDYFTFTIRGSTVAPTSSDAAKFHSNSANGGGIHDMVGNFGVAEGSWHLVHVVYDGTDKIIYVNGTEDARALNPHGGNEIGSSNTRYGFIGDGSEATAFNGARDNIYFDGITDDVRISIVGRSVDWNLAEYNNQFSPYTFYTVGIEEEYGVPQS